MPASYDPNATPQGRAAIPQTRWSLILEAKEENPEALAALCQQYWHPLYAYARRKGSSVEDAQDLTQSFMMHLVNKDFFKGADPKRGRLRSLLLKSFKHHCINSAREQQAAKRGGDTPIIAIDAVSAEAWLAMEPTDNVSPELEYDRQWTRGILREAKQNLQEAYTKAGKRAEFDAFADQLVDGHRERSHREIAEELGIEESQARFVGFKLRQRFRDLLLEIVADTVATRAEAADELDQILKVFQTPDSS